MESAEKMLSEIDSIISDDPAGACIKAATLLAREKQPGHQLRLIGRLIQAHWRLGNYPVAEEMISDGAEIIRRAEARGSTNTSGLSVLDRAEFCGYCCRYAAAREDWDTARTWLDTGLRLTMPRSVDPPTSPRGKARERRRRYLRAVTLVSHARHLAIHGHIDRAANALGGAFQAVPTAHRRTPLATRHSYNTVKISILTLWISILIGANRPIPDELMALLEDPALPASLGRTSRAELYRCTALAAVHRKEPTKAVKYYTAALEELSRAGAYGEIPRICDELRGVAPKLAASWDDYLTAIDV